MLFSLIHPHPSLLFGHSGPAELGICASFILPPQTILQYQVDLVHRSIYDNCSTLSKAFPYAL
jgi:hypothetical protein